VPSFLPVRILRLLQAVGALVCLGIAPAQTPAASDPITHARLPIRVYNDRDGLPQNSVETVLFDREGYLWVGTQDGAARYDGRNWQVLSMPRPTRSSWVVAHLAAADGSHWFGTRGDGLQRYKDGTWTHFGPEEGFPDGQCMALAEGRDEGGRAVVWAGTQEHGLVMVRDGKLLPQPSPASHPFKRVNCLNAVIGEDGEPVLWVGTERGLLSLSKGQWQGLDKRDYGLPSDNVLSTLTYGTDPHRALWVGTDRGLALRSANGWQRWDETSGLANAYVYRLATSVDASGGAVLWAGTEGGLAKYERGAWILYDARHALPSSVVRSMTVKQDGQVQSLWIGTFAGLSRITLGKWSSFTTLSGLPENVVFGITGTRDGTMWFATLGGGLASLKDGRWTVADHMGGRPAKAVMTLVRTEEAGQESVWAAFRDVGLFRFTAGRWTPWKHNAALPDTWIYALAETRENGRPVRWIGTRQGLVREDDQGIRVLTQMDGLGGNFVTAILEARDAAGRRQLFVGCRGGGLSRLDLESGTWHRYTTADLPGLRVSDLKEFPGSMGERFLWVATHGGGTSRLNLAANGAAWTHFSTRSAIPVASDTSYRVEQDALRRVYIFTLKGITRLTPAIPALPAEYSSYTFTTGDGLPSNGCTQGSSFMDAKGRIWTGTVAGAAVFDPNQDLTDTEKKPLYLNAFSIHEGSRALPEEGKLPHDRDHVRFEFSLLSYLREGDVRYRVQLKGLDSDASPWMADGKMEYPTLRAGTYTFRVWGRDASGNETGPREHTFTVLPAPWATWWAQSLYGLALVGLVVWLIRRRVGHLKEANADLEAKVAERTRELAVARDEALAATRMKSEFLATISHEIRTPLNGVIGMSGLLLRTPLDESQRDYAGTVQSSAESLLTLLNDVLDFSKIEAGRVELEDIPFDLADEIEETAALLSENAHRKGLELAVVLAPELPTGFRGDPGRLRQVLNNLVGNAIKFTQRGTVTLRISRAAPAEGDGAAIRVRFDIIDSGIGMSSESLARVFEAFTQADSSTTRRFGGTGLGLAICRRLVDLMGGRVQVASTPWVGTTFTVEIPLLPSGEADADHAGDLPPALRVLAASPFPITLEGLAYLLHRWGIAPESAGAAELPTQLREAAAGAAPFDLLILDLDLPESRTPGFIQTLREAANQTRLPVLLLATGPRLEQIGQLQLPGHAVAIHKPVRRVRLKEAMRRLVAGQAGEGLSTLRTGPVEALVPLRPEARILVADDNPLNPTGARWMLVSFGYTPDLAGGGFEALAAMERTPFDLVFLDCNMPGLDGFAVTREVRVREGTARRTPIIALTASALGGTREKCLAMGMDGYLSKPLRPELMKATLDQWLGGEGPDEAVAAPSEDSAPPAPPRTDEPLDARTLAGLQALDPGNTDGWVRDLVRDYLTDGPLRLEGIRAALAAADGPGAVRHLHNLKSNSATLGAKRFAALCEDLEMRAENGDLATVATALGTLTSAWAEVERALEAYHHPLD